MDYTISMSIWDLGSQKMFQRVRKEYYMGAHVGVLVFDLSRRSTLESLGSWVGELKQFAGEDVAFIVVGNKSDLDHEISFEEATKEAKKWGAGYIETSALEGDNVEDAFNLCSYELINKYKSRNI